MGKSWLGLEWFAEEAEGQAEFFDRLCPLYARLLRMLIALLEDDDATRARIADGWRTRPFHARYERPLLLCASLRFDAMRDASSPLASVLGEDDPDDAALTRDALRDALARPSVLASMRDRYVQTNEVTRAIAWRLPATLLLDARVIDASRPIALVDLGCSAALNLVADALDLTWTDGEGAAIPLVLPTIVKRLGVDRAPVDPRHRDAADWLRASIWPGEARRRKYLDAALARATEAIESGELAVEAAEARAWPRRLHAISAAHPRAFVLAYQTVVRDYLLPDVRADYETGARAWLAAHAGRALWVELERSPKGSPGPAELRAHVALRDGRSRDGAGARSDAANGQIRTLVLGWGDYHPRSLNLHNGALRELMTLL